MAPNTLDSTNVKCRKPLICKNRHFSQNLSNISDKKRPLSHFPPQRLSSNFQAAEGEPFLAQVLQRGTNMIHRVVDAERKQHVFNFSAKLNLFALSC